MQVEAEHACHIILPDMSHAKLLREHGGERQFGGSIHLAPGLILNRNCLRAAYQIFRRGAVIERSW